MRDIDELLPEVLPNAPNAPEPLVYRCIIEAARKMCHDIRLWRDYDSFTVSTPGCEGIITIPDAEIVEIQQASINGNPLSPTTVGWLDENYPGWDQQTEGSGARYITQLNPKTISVSPRESGDITLRMVLQPSIDALTVPDVLVNLHATTLGRGASGRLLIIPNTDFVNPQLGVSLLAEFESKVASLKTEHTKGQQGARLRTKGDWF